MGELGKVTYIDEDSLVVVFDNGVKILVTHRSAAGRLRVVESEVKPC